ncbi:MAG: sirohydrochlorin chelatase [Myxococcota bacterium]
MTRGILLVDHGSRRAEANAVVERIAGQLARRVPDTIVRVAHMEIAEPTVAQGLASCIAAGADDIVVHPYFLGPGHHSTHDIPRLLREAGGDHPDVRMRISAPLGAHPKLVDVILERIDAAPPSDITDGQPAR